MKIRFIKPAGLHAVGDVIDPDPPVAHLLIQRGVAVPAEAQEQEPETAAVAPPEKAVRKRGRPRKKALFQ